VLRERHRCGEARLRTGRAVSLEHDDRVLLAPFRDVRVGEVRHLQEQRVQACLGVPRFHLQLVEAAGHRALGVDQALALLGILRLADRLAGVVAVLPHRLHLHERGAAL
jgi:hypothetical protein